MADPARVTQVALEILADEPGAARVTQVALEILADEPGAARVTQVALEVCGQAFPLIAKSVASSAISETGVATSPLLK